MFWCPGCEEAHGVWTESPNGLTGAKWSFNGNMERPTFAPSLLVRGVKCPAKDPETNDYKRGEDGKYLLDSQGRLLGARDVVCHTFITDGRIQYLSDCTHKMAGQTVPMEAF